MTSWNKGTNPHLLGIDLTPSTATDLMHWKIRTPEQIYFKGPVTQSMIEGVTLPSLQQKKDHSVCPSGPMNTYEDSLALINSDL
ncbi:hypothetical protein E2C01_041024 [Portunus trituberculatus]|uniref:Uncharacterized protein n=1 Tax=Portunus trituberculatus TaxID=210409 RepID=A0A5B7FLB7_PORTR|nr:hypothetical protein [Portunus trituberculatus]